MLKPIEVERLPAITEYYGDNDSPTKRSTRAPKSDEVMQSTLVFYVRTLVLGDRERSALLRETDIPMRDARELQHDSLRNTAEDLGNAFFSTSGAASCDL